MKNSTVAARAVFRDLMAITIRMSFAHHNTASTVNHPCRFPAKRTPQSWIFKDAYFHVSFNSAIFSFTHPLCDSRRTWKVRQGSFRPAKTTCTFGPTLPIPLQILHSVKTSVSCVLLLCDRLLSHSNINIVSTLQLRHGSLGPPTAAVRSVMAEIRASC